MILETETNQYFVDVFYLKNLTTATITMFDSIGIFWKRTVTGFSVCSNRDKFSKIKGRKIAIARAIELLKLPKDERASFWYNLSRQMRLT